MTEAFRSRLFLLFFLANLLSFTFLPGIASGDSLRGKLDFDYNMSEVTSRDNSGITTKTESSSFTQRYRIFLNKSIFPRLVLNAGGLFERVDGESESGSLETDFTTTTIQPDVRLTLATPLYKAGVGYRRREEERKSSLSSPTTDVNEIYNATLAWSPVDYPEWRITYSRSNLYDKARAIQDSTTDRALLTVRYEYGGLDLRYQPSYTDTTDRIGNLEIESISQNARASYSGSFFRERISLSANYEITRTETEVVDRGGAGEVSFPLFPLLGLSVIDDTPDEGALDPNAALIDGNLTAGAGLNLGLPPPSGDTRPRNMGLDFVNVSEVNTLFVWIDRELPPEIADAYSWDIYTSANNQNWTLLTTVFPSPFGPFQDRFEIRFPNVTARYIKVATRPLAVTVPRASEFPDVFVTELQATLRRPAAEVRGETEQTRQNGSMDLRARLLDHPSLYYEFSFSVSDRDDPPRTTYTLSNGLSISRRFSEKVSVSGRVAREDSDDDITKTEAYSYTASLSADPLKTLHHTLLFTGRNEDADGDSRDSYFFYLRNTARLYRGIDVFLNGGFGRSKSGSEGEQDSYTLNFGAGFVPHETLTLTVNFNGTRTERTGGGRPDDTAEDRRGDAGLSFRPFQNLYLTASVSRVEKENDKDTLQNYTVNWSPFPSGSLRFNFAFNQTLSKDDDSKTRSIHPSMRWNVTNKIFLDLSYQFVESEASSGSSDLKTFFAKLQLNY